MLFASSYALTIAISASLCVLAAISLHRIALAVGWVDRPNGRKHHESDTPLTGGVCIALAVAVTTLLISTNLASTTGVIAGGLLMLLVGGLDDIFEIRARYRFVAQIVAGVAVIFLSGVKVQFLGEIFGPFPLGLGFLAVPFSLVAIAGLINAFNMSDGLDGLCGGHVLISLGWLAVAASFVDLGGGRYDLLPVVDGLAMPVIGALIGFLILNSRYLGRRGAKLFLGDGGSMMLGLLVAWMAIVVTHQYTPETLSDESVVAAWHGLEPVSAVWMVAIPLIDLFACMVRRYVEGVAPMQADRRHLHHLVCALGFSPGQSVAIIHLLALVAGGIGFLLWRLEVPAYIGFWSLVAVCAMYTRYSIKFWGRSA